MSDKSEKVPKPSLGRDVHFVPQTQGVAEARDHLAAKICKVHSEEIVNLVAWTEHGQQLAFTSVSYDPEGKSPYSWHWPERTSD